MSIKNAELISHVKHIDPFVAANSEMPFLSEQEKQCADLLLNFPEKVIKSSISEFASFANTSQATVIRFTRKLGYKGYPHFKLAIVASIGFQAGSIGKTRAELELGIAEQDEPSEVLSKLMNSSIMTLQQTANLCDFSAVQEAAALIEAAKIVATYGAGASNLVAQDCSFKFARLGKPSINFSDNHHALSSVSSLNQNDVLLIVSHSGNTPEVLGVAKQFASKGTRLICITNDAKSPLAECCEVVLRTQAERKAIRIGATVSRIAQLFLVDFLTLSWAQRSWSKAKQASDAARVAVIENNERNQIEKENWSRRRSIPARESKSSNNGRKHEYK